MTRTTVPAEPRPLTVSQVNALIQGVLAAHLPSIILVQGEISNYRTYEKGHAFFTLKEPGAELSCVCWKDCLARMKFKPRDGMEVVARGAIRVYEAQGKVQLYVDEIVPRGTGALELAFRQLCEKLKAEGLFAAQRKRKLPQLPERVVVITSRTGDVLHDVLTTAYRRFPGLHVMLVPVRVQGAAAAPEIVRAIGFINRHAATLRPDLILLVRGGGSLEDLWAFNEEPVARAIVASQIPIATGIGHEPDTTIADLVSDLRGPTPTGVTELTIPDVRVLRQEIDAMAAGLGRDIRNFVGGAGADLLLLGTQLLAGARQHLQRQRQRIETMGEHVKRIEPRHAIAQGWRRVEEAQRQLADAQRIRLRAAADRLARMELRLERHAPTAAVRRSRDRLETLAAKLQRALAGRLTLGHQRLAALGHHLRAVSPQAVLERGFSITQNAEGKIVRKTADVKKGERITTRVADGEIRSVVGEPRQGTLF